MKPSSIDPRAIARLCVNRRLRGASALLTRHYNERLRHAGVTAAQFTTLVSIAAADRPSVADIAEATGIDASTVTRNLQMLEDSRLIASDGGRGRSGKRLQLTAEGQAALERAVSAWQAVNQELVDRLGPEQLKAGLAFLAALEGATRR